MTRANCLAISGSVRQKLLVSSDAELGLVGRAHDRGRHVAGPPEVVALERVEQGLDVACALKPPT